MLSRRKELQFRIGRQQLEGTLAQWCGLTTSILSPPKDTCRPETTKHKISIKQYRIKQGHKYSKSQPLNFLTQHSAADVHQPPMFNAKTARKVNFTFSYGRSCSYLQHYSIQEKMPSLSMKSISAPEQYSQNYFKLASQQAKLSRAASACYNSQHDEPSKSQPTEGIVTAIDHQNDDERPQRLQRLEQASMLAHADKEGVETWQATTANKVDTEEDKKGLDDYRFFSRPQIKNFQRGDLFNVVKRSQTLQNDYQSQSETSQVLQDFKSLMSKIHQNGIEEQFQQI